MLLDNNVLVEALEKGNKGALRLIKKSDAYITPHQLDEFMYSGIRNQAQRARFLKRHRIKELYDPDFALRQDFLDIVQRGVSQHGFADMALLGYSRASGITAYTIEKGAFNFGTLSLPPRLRVNMAKIPSAR